MTEAVHRYVYNGGALFGVGEPSAVQFQGKYFQLSDVLGVDREMSLSIAYNRYNIETEKNEFIMNDVREPIDYINDMRHVYALDDVKVLDIAFEKPFTGNVNCGHVKFATNEYGITRRTQECFTAQCFGRQRKKICCCGRSAKTFIRNVTITLVKIHTRLSITAIKSK